MACVVSPGCGGAGLRNCPEGQYCDGTLARCLPSPATRMCTLTTTSNEFRPVEAWRWAGSSAHPAFKGVLVTPLVADVNHDGASDVLVLAYRDPSNSTGTIADEAILCALSGPGDCNGAARELWCSDPTDSAGLLNGWGNFAVADLDATDGRGELTIVTGLHRGALGAQGVAAFNERGQRVWVGHDRAGATVDAFLYGGAITVADLDGDGHGEVIVGGSVFDHTGLLRFTVAGAHAGNGGFGPIAVTADLDVPADGRLEVISGNVAYRADGTLLWTSPVIGDGYPAVADFNGDGEPDIAVIAAGTLAVLDRQGRALVPATNLSSLGFSGRGGAPTVADLDRDGRPDLGVAGASAYLALRVVRAGDAWRFERIWTQPADDTSSNVTGSAMFDFDGDGVSEVIYQDTCRARVFNGTDGRVLMDIANVSGTATNYPTVADLNGDGRAEFILVNDSFYARSGLIPCPATTPRLDGVRVFRDANDNWQTTRALWNQHAYHVTNVCDGSDGACAGTENVHGALPRRELPSWGAGFNRFRVNAQFGLSARVAPDLVPLGLSAALDQCPGRLVLRLDVANRGSATVAVGAPVTFYEGDPAGGRRALGTVRTARALLPGATERVVLSVTRASDGGASASRFHAVVNDDGTGAGAFRECDVANNTSPVVSVYCDAPE